MTNSEIGQKVKQFLESSHLQNNDYPSLIKAVEELGYTVIEFNSSYNDENTQTVLEELNLSAFIKKSKGFTYSFDEYRLIFINESLSKHEKQMVLSHEIGHIVCGHLISSPANSQNVQEEYEANEFSHQLLNPSKKVRFSVFTYKHKKAIIAAVLAIVLVLSSTGIVLTVQKQSSYYGEYYVTSAGKKYHEKNCIFVKNKTNVRRLTKDEFNSGEYEACEICLP